MEDIIYEYWAATLQDGYIPDLIDLVERAGGAKSLYNMTPEQIKNELVVTDKMVSHIIKCRDNIDIQKSYDEMCQSGIHYVNHSDCGYPTRLHHIHGRPYGLFYKGSLPSENRKNIAIIGSRECSEYGRLIAEYLGDRLSRSNIDIISGMAWGIDGISQMSAINAGGHSYGILGCGVDIIYPRKNNILYQHLTENGNGVISEYAPKTPPDPRKFPPRNRIISGLCDILIVVEAKAKSGTLITVDMAIDQGRTIMVVPGRITDPLSVGCLNLLKEGAIPITSLDDIYNELNSISSSKSNYTQKTGEIFDEKPNINSSLSNNEIQILKYISLDPIHIDSLVNKSHLPLNTVIVILTSLEMRGYIKETSHFTFVRNIKL